MIAPVEFGNWYYLIYLVPGGIALLLLLLSALGGGMNHHHGGAGHGHHAPVSSVHTHTATAHTPHAPATSHSQGQTHKTSATVRGQTPLSFFGVGRVPAPLVWGSALLGWGVFGFWGTQLWQRGLHVPGLFALPALATALAGAFVTEKATVEAASRFLPNDETYATETVELCGLTGTVVFPVDGARGRVHVYDAHGTLHDMSARTAPNAPPVARGGKVLVVDYDAGRDKVIVEEVGS